MTADFLLGTFVLIGAFAGLIIIFIKMRKSDDEHPW